MSKQASLLSRQTVSKIIGQLKSTIRDIDALLSQRERIRDQMIKLSRDIIRYSSWAINALHQGLVDEARKLLNELDNLTAKFLSLAKQDPVLYYSGLVYSTLAEYTEAKIFYSITIESVLPTPKDLGVDEVSYLQGLCDAIGELRRLALDMLRIGKVEQAEVLLDIMEGMYYELRGLEYPDALIPGVKRKIDAIRRLIDDTKTLLVEVKGRGELVKLLESKRPL